MHKLFVFILTASLFSGLISLAASAQPPTKVNHLTEQLLSAVPDLPVTARAFGRGEERLKKAQRHAEAIVAASNEYQPAWNKFVQEGHWEHFDPQKHLPYLIAALTKRESSFQPVIRLDGGERIYSVNQWRKHRFSRADVGVMQVRAPTQYARECGVETRPMIIKLLNDLEFAYAVGTCILTKRIEYFSSKYTQRKYRRFYRGGRPARELRFYGVAGKRKGTFKAKLARELAVIERYNWGIADLYQHPRGAGYARRIISEFESLYH